MIYEKDEIYYLKNGEKYEVAEITLKPHTISIVGTGQFIDELEEPYQVYTFKELKDKLLGE